MASIKNVKALHKKLSELYTNVETGKVSLKKARELTNVAGKFISSSKAQLELKMFLKDKTPVSFLKDE